MSRAKKILLAILSGTQDNSLMFSDLQAVLFRLGFQCRSRGDHFIYIRENVEEIINLQPLAGKAKTYQVKQVRQMILKYHLGGEIYDEV